MVHCNSTTVVMMTRATQRPGVRSYAENRKFLGHQNHPSVRLTELGWPVLRFKRLCATLQRNCCDASQQTVGRVPSGKVHEAAVNGRCVRCQGMADMIWTR